MTFILPSFGASAISAVPSGGGGELSNTYSVDLDGTNDYVAVGASSDFSFGTSDFSFSAWFYPDVVSGFRPVIDFRQSSGNLLPSLYYSTTSGYRLYLWTGSSQVANYNTTLTAGQWYHVVYTRSGTAGTIYLNGTSVATGTDSSNYSLNGQPHIGGKAPGVTASYHDGPIDEVSVFNSALSASDVSDMYNSGVPTDISSLSPVAWWRMGDNDSGTGTTVTDQGSGGNDGTLTNGPTFSTNVPTFPNTYSVDIDGTNDYIDCGGASDFSFTDGSGNDLPFSISAWVKFDNVNKERLVSKDTSTSSREFLFGTDNANVANIVLGTATVNLNIRNTTPLNLTDWFHIVSTYDGSKSASGLKVYVNANDSNRLDISSGSYAGISATGGNLEIGRFANGNSFFNGLIDEVAVFDYELSSAQVTSIYNSGVPNNIASLSPLGWWRMGDNDGGTGTTITDQGSGGNNGTLTNGPTFSTTVPS